MKNQTDFREKIKHGSEAFPVALYNCGSFAPYHWHPEYEFIYIARGKATYLVNTSIITLSEGDCCICKGGQLHSFTFNADGPASGYALVFDLKFLLKDMDICSKFFLGEYLINYKFSAYNEKEKIIADTTKEICEVFKKKSFAYELEVKMLLVKIFVDIFKYGFYEQATETSQENKVEKSLMSVIQHIHTLYYEKISIQSLAQLTGYSVSHFGRLFKASIGKTPEEYIISYRLYKACELLLSSDKSILEIAVACGFLDISYFIKTFKKKYGCTPYHYRRM